MTNNIMLNLPFTLDHLKNKINYPLLFITISGAHLYGFASPDSDYDLRTCHILSATEVLGLKPGKETIQINTLSPKFELDLVSHDIKKFLEMLLKKNGYVLEQLYSPLIFYTTPEHEELKELAKNTITRYHAYHYLGFAEKQWQLFAKENPPRVKPLLYLYRVLLTGIYLMQTGIIEANLVNLNQEFNLPYISGLIATKTDGTEKVTLTEPDFIYHQQEYQKLRQQLEQAFQSSHLRETSEAYKGFNDLLIRLRLLTLHTF